jgi:hypothetical protein
VSEISDVILAAGPSVVAMAAIGSAVWKQRRGFRHARSMADLENVRELLDEAAVALHRADYARYSVAVGRIRQGEYLWEREPDVVEKVVTAGVALDELSERLAVRLGPDHEVVTHFHDGGPSAPVAGAVGGVGAGRAPV